MRRWGELLPKLRIRSKSHPRADGGEPGEGAKVKGSHMSSPVLRMLLHILCIFFELQNNVLIVFSYLELIHHVCFQGFQECCHVSAQN